MEFQDKVLTCIDCGTDFVFTAGEQMFFHDKQFKNQPKRCKTCKSKRVAVLTAPHAPGTGITTPVLKLVPPAHNAARIRLCLFVPRRAGPFSVANASRKRET